MTDDSEREPTESDSEWTAESDPEWTAESDLERTAEDERTETTGNTTTRSMTETSTDAPETETARSTTSGDDGTDTETTASNSRFDRFSTDDLRGIIDRIGLAALVLLALIAGWGFYSQAGRAIRTWLDPAYQPIALAAFNLAILLVALAGVAHQLYRIRRSEGTEESAPEPRNE